MLQLNRAGSGFGSGLTSLTSTTEHDNMWLDLVSFGRDIYVKFQKLRGNFTIFEKFGRGKCRRILVFKKPSALRRRFSSPLQR